MPYSALTPRQRDVLDAIVSETDRLGRPPTLVALGRRLGMSGTMVARHALALAREGFIIPGPAPARPMRGYRLGALPSRRGYALLGSVPAGPLTDALGEIGEADIAESIEDLVPGVKEGDFCLEVSGDSMDLAGLTEGMVMFLRPGVHPDPGEICAVHIEGEGGTLKRVFHEGAQVRLEPESSNPAHRPMWYGEDDVQIQGVLVTALHVQRYR